MYKYIKKLLVFISIVVTFIFLVMSLGTRDIEPKLSNLMPSDIPMVSEDIEIFQDILSSALEIHKYNTIALKSQLVDLYDNDPDFSIQQWKNTKKWRRLKSDGDGDCINLSHNILKKLNPKLNAQIIGSRLPLKYKHEKSKEVQHVAIAIKYVSKDEISYVLIDPGMFIPIPIVLSTSIPKRIFKTEHYSLSCELRGDVISCYSDRFGINNATNEPDSIVYYLNGFSNYVDYIGQYLSLINLNPSIIITDRDGDKLGCIIVDLKESMVFWRVKEKYYSVEFERIAADGFPIEFYHIQDLMLDSFDLTKRQIINLVVNSEKMLQIHRDV